VNCLRVNGLKTEVETIDGVRRYFREARTDFHNANFGMDFCDRSLSAAEPTRKGPISTVSENGRVARAIAFVKMCEVDPEPRP